MTTYSSTLRGGAANRGTAAPGSANMTVNKTTNWGDLMMGEVARPANCGVVRKVYDPVTLYTDMADEPWKYEDDMLDVWEPLDEQLQITCSERVESYWRARDARESAVRVREERAEALRRKAFLPIAKQAAAQGAKRWIDRDIKAFVARIRNAVVTIQAIARGYLVRCNTPHLDCCMCLSHRVSPLRTKVGYMCRDCGNAGPFTDVVEDDSWGWFRAEYVDEGICA
jgi:hypothetical protein